MPNDRCRLCDRDADDTVYLGTRITSYGEVPLCNGHLAALRLGEWWLTVKLMDNTATLSGARGGFRDKPPSPL